MRLSYWLVENFSGPACSLKLPGGEKMRLMAYHGVLYLGVPDGHIKIRYGDKPLQHPLVDEFRRQLPYKIDPNGKELLKPFTSITPSDVAALIKKNTVPDKWFLQNFLILFTTSVCDSNSNGSANLKILSILEDLSVVPQLDWGEYIVRSLVKAVNNWEGVWFHGPVFVVIGILLSICASDFNVCACIY